MSEKDPWWESGWFWGGVAPLLPVVAVAGSAMLGLGHNDTLILLVLFAAPITIFMLCACTGLLISFFGDLVHSAGAIRAVLYTSVAIAGMFLLYAVTRSDCEDWIEAGRYAEQRVCVR